VFGRYQPAVVLLEWYAGMMFNAESNAVMLMTSCWW